MNRRPAAPPKLMGYTFVRDLGTGGFADVYQYEQHLPRRQVAVKVLIHSDTTSHRRAKFDAEANLMAAVSNHPSIVTIYHADVSPEGRPYFVMQYCKDNLAAQYKTREFDVREVLRIGVQLAGAVESAHRAGILHRDIKPANVLITDFRPALTDFGISVSAGMEDRDDQVGLTIPWSPPEMCVGAPNGDERADVYSLAATLYTLLARRSPFEIAGRPGTQADLIHRILNTPLPPIGRPDVPAIVSRVLTKAMEKDVAARYPRALDFARALQHAQTELGYEVTTVEVADEDPDAARHELTAQDEGVTRIRPLVVIDAQAEVKSDRAGAAWASRTVVADQAPVDQTQLRPAQPLPDYLKPEYLANPLTHDTVARPTDRLTTTAPIPAEEKSPLRVILTGAVLALLAVGIAVVLLTRGTETGAGTTPLSITDGPDDQGADLVQPVTDMTSAIVGSDILFTWTNPETQPEDRYRWERTRHNDPQQKGTVDETRVAVPIDQQTRDLCIQVTVIRANGTFSPPVEHCQAQAAG
jgi:Protein kinase domain